MRIARILLAAALLLNLQPCTAEDSVAIGTRPPALQQRIDAALAVRGAAYRPRTEHRLANGQPRYTNRLILEDSPYLLQHAHNPVDWYPWGKEAFDKARRENKLVFLSIGYSTCHWCHVMEKESFENPAIARLLNQHFVAIKVDRERRPDLDHLYMTAVNLLAGRGGWPMTSLLTPDGHTAHGGTYYRPDDLTQLLTKIEQLWRDHPGELKAQSAAVARAVDKAMAQEAVVAELPPTLAATTTRQLLEHHDALQGGFGTAPKFPNEPLLALLLDQAVRANDRAARTALTTDLDAMAAGGIHDQAGGGFYRYSTDSEWRVPHFEKMLYTQAQLARLYIAAGRGKGEYARVARRAFDFVLREMHAPDGGFYSALDADSADGEGRGDLWTPAAVRKALGAGDAAFAIQQYGISAVGDFEGSTILHLSQAVSGKARARLDRIDAALLKARQQRPRPPRDDKVLTGWNGLMITALAEAGDRLDEPRYLAAARCAAETLWQHRRRADGGLWRVSLNGRASTAGMLEDYAYLAEGLIALYDATGETVWLVRAQQLADAMQSRFSDPNGGSYFLAEADPDTPMARPRDTADGALPSANGVAVHVLAALARRSGEMRFEAAAEAQLAALSGAIQRDPAGHATLLTAMARVRSGETGARQYAGRGAVMASARAIPQGKGARIELTLRIKPGWHINAHRPLQDYLIPTTLTAVGANGHIGRIDYPQAEVAKLSFQTEALALYQGDVIVRAELQGKAGPADGTVPLELRLQACSDRICLPPETLRLGAQWRN